MDLIVQTRDKFGKAVKALRRGGFVPAELYGRDISNVHLAVSMKDFMKVFREAGANTVVHLVLNSEKRPVLIHDVEKDYLTNEVSHVDFYQVRMDEKIKARVPIEFTGEAPAVKEKGGILNKAMSEIEVEALPADLPHRLHVDLGTLDELNKSLYVKDLRVSPKAKLLVELETVIVTVTPPSVEEEKAPETPIDVTAVKVEDEEKKAERAAEKEKKE